MTTPDTTLTRIDEALEAGAVTAADPEDREIQELALALRADSPVAGPGFEARLDARVAAGFPRERRFERGLPRPPRPKLLALGAAASMLVALAVAVALSGSGREDAGGALESRGSEGARAPTLAERESGEDDSARSAPVEPPSGGGIAPGERNRRIERSASLTLAAPGDRLDAVADDIVSVTDRRGGFVLRSSLSTGDEGTTGGSFDLRIPARSLQPALRDLSEFGEVRARSQSGEDITKGFVSVDDRLDAARAERRSLLRRLEKADGDREAQAIRDRLKLVSAEIRGLAAQLRDLRERTSYAAVSVRLVERNGDAGASGTGDAFRDALDSLLASFNVAVRVIGFAIPLLLVGGPAWLAAGLLRRRRREAALL